MGISDVMDRVQNAFGNLLPESSNTPIQGQFQSAMPALGPAGVGAMKDYGLGFNSAMQDYGGGFQSRMGPSGGFGGFNSKMQDFGGGFNSIMDQYPMTFNKGMSEFGQNSLFNMMNMEGQTITKARDDIWKKQQDELNRATGSGVSGGSGLSGDANKAQRDRIAGTNQWDDMIEKAAKEAGVPASVIKGLMAIESGGQANIGTNTSGATGLMQVVGSIWQSVANNYGGDLNDPWTNIRTAAEILKSNKQQYGTWEGAIAAYLGSPVQDDTGAWRGGTVADANGTTGQMYVDIAKNNIAYIEAMGGGNTLPTADGYANPWAQGALNFAAQAVGTPYVWGGESYEEGGFDCSGLVDAMYKSQGKNVGRPTSQTIHNTWTAINRNELKAGDLITYSFPGGQEGADHVAIYIGDGKIIHATGNGNVTKIQNMDDLASNEIGYRRVT